MKKLTLRRQLRNINMISKKILNNIKRQDYVAPKWVQEALGSPQENESTRASTYKVGTSSSSWEDPISDTQAVHIGDFLLTAQEEQAFLAEEEGLQEPDKGPSWETIWFSELEAYR